MISRVRSLATRNIAADDVFSLGMLARFELNCRGTARQAYRELLWEAGMIGQALYLAVEAKRCSWRHRIMVASPDDAYAQVLSRQGRYLRCLLAKPHFIYGTDREPKAAHYSSLYAFPICSASVKRVFFLILARC